MKSALLSQICDNNTYNIVEIGFVLGMGKSERVLEVVQHSREKGTLQSRAQSKLYANVYFIASFRNYKRLDS